MKYSWPGLVDLFDIESSSCGCIVVCNRFAGCTMISLFFEWSCKGPGGTSHQGRIFMSFYYLLHTTRFMRITNIVLV